jgi:hypothetical protein
MRVRISAERQLKLFCPLVRLYAYNNSRAAGLIFMKFYTGELYETLSSFNFGCNRTKITDTLYGDQHAFLHSDRVMCHTPL